jgi:ABC-2 type transport system permease protein
MEEPNGTLARILGWFPLTAPITMMLRLGTGQVPWWDVAVAVLILMAGVFLAIRLAGGLLRLGLLMYGKRPSLPEIIRLLRHS